MSRVYFHSESGQAELLGSERAHMGLLIGDIFVATLRVAIENDTPSCPSPLRNVVNDGWWTQDFPRNMPLACRSLMSDELRFVVDGKSHDPWQVSLNTALVIGNDVLKMFARIHGQCEIHAYVLGPNRNWLAGIIDTGLSKGLCRKGQGWEGVTNLLRRCDDRPVVTSSVCDRFPNSCVAGWSDDNDGDDWYNLAFSRRWEMAFSRLEQSDQCVEITPKDWDDFTFGGGLDAFRLLEHARDIGRAESRDV